MLNSFHKKLLLALLKTGKLTFESVVKIIREFKNERVNTEADCEYCLIAMSSLSVIFSQNIGNNID
jgi:hypothetical protein